jgi:uncharacterized membrane protein YgcG
VIARAVVILLALAANALADERILDYHTDILIRADGFIEVTETIAVRAEGRQIRRGIYRDYPTRYRDGLGNDVEVIYEPRSVTRNGDPEAFSSDDYRNGIRTYFGQSDRLLDNGEHIYVYRYGAGRMLGYFEAYDELYWNVTGNGWAFPIDNATASIRFAFDVDPDALSLNAWQGPFGRAEPASTSLDSDRNPNFGATRPLRRQEGLTIAVGWPKGLVAEPTQLQRFIWLLSDNLNLLIALAGLAAIFSYYIPAWRGYGRDPEPGVIFPRYAPPEGFSPASLRYIGNMGYDNETMTAGIVSLAVKGYLRIDADGEDHMLHKVDAGADAPVLATGERELCTALFSGRRYVKLVDDNHEIIGGARKAHEASLKRDYHKRYFVTNGLLNLPPLLIALISMIVAASIRITIPMVAVGLLMLVTVITFAILLKRPTRLGRALLDESAGFTEYLEIAEKDEMNLRNPPEKTPALFESYLPFALALGVEQAWAERFARIFATLEGPNQATWHPAWYQGDWNNFDLSETTSGLSSSLGSAISASATPPGSSSGGGGGFSGGGGGGGGGGGW